MVTLVSSVYTLWQSVALKLLCLVQSCSLTLRPAVTLPRPGFLPVHVECGHKPVSCAVLCGLVGPLHARYARVELPPHPRMQACNNWHFAAMHLILSVGAEASTCLMESQKSSRERLKVSMWNRRFCEREDLLESARYARVELPTPPHPRLQVLPAGVLYIYQSFVLRQNLTQGAFAGVLRSRRILPFRVWVWIVFASQSRAFVRRCFPSRLYVPSHIVPYQRVLKFFRQMFLDHSILLSRARLAATAATDVQLPMCLIELVQVMPCRVKIQEKWLGSITARTKYTNMAQDGGPQCHVPIFVVELHLQ